ncbi:Fe-S protein assembly co-chaperone HscB [Candidatus Odyssella acanthamoebae]|uniref:Fe-S protein assembly co-chaperone HscB n=1 Tax=Candidatus Odyssella acanthamoebae TaxID=91604 RepID=UPI0018DC4BE8|nr:Fe-S protein assembly co-chaperone HscB [Candidatus Paracaedibacter acanthamoebae]
MKRGDVVAESRSMSNAFETFGLSPKYNIDLLDLENRHRRALSFVHPDLFVTKTAQERTAAASLAVKFNESYQILKDPLKRAAELLKSHGVEVPGENGKTVGHSTLLVRVMQWREELASYRFEKELTKLETELKKRLDFVKSAFDGSDADSLPYLYLEFVYLTKILEEIHYHPLRKPHVRSTR